MLITICITVVVCVTLGLYFQYKNRNLKHLAISQEVYLIEETLKHRNQIQWRQSNLDKYHFLRYNLDESLVVQSEINI